VVRLTGDTGSRKDRRLALVRFSAAEARILVATDVAGEGPNLHEHCHHLVHFELPWNPNRMEQRNGRIDRYGQTKPPTIAFLYVEDSYEGEVLKRLVLKIEAQMRMLGSVGDVLGQIQADSIEQLLSRPVSDLHRAVAITAETSVHPSSIWNTSGSEAATASKCRPSKPTNGSLRRTDASTPSASGVGDAGPKWLRLRWGTRGAVAGGRFGTPAEPSCVGNQ
jgi:superfamily II DNA/RNA helicase